MDENQLTPIYGWMVAANPIGQMIAAPILGVISNKMGSIRGVGIGCAIAFILGNFLYAIPSLLPQGNGRIWILIASRFITGLSSGIVHHDITYL